MGILSRIKRRLPIVGGDPITPRPTAQYTPAPAAPAPARPAPPPPMDPAEVLASIKADVEAHKIVVYMKGSAQAPQCGFSAKVAQTFLDMGVPFEARDVLADPAVRSAIKEFTDWPTIPQVFIDGEFIGGCDIVLEMQASGELDEAVRKALESA
jgi:monothiol glutaredoxin